MHPSDFTNREWEQMRAALAFWLEIASVGKQHPSTHPSAAAQFKECAPMTDAQVQTLLDRGPGLAWLTRNKVAAAFGCTPETVQRHINRLRIEPDMIVAHANVYRAENLAPVFERLERSGKTPRW